MSRARGVIAVIAVAACSTPSSPEGEPPDARDPGGPPDGRPGDPDLDAPPTAIDEPGQPGRWAVGVRTVSVTDTARARTFAVDVWYPVDPANPDGDDNRYELLGGLISLESPARRDAAPATPPVCDDAPCPWPLVVFSHGYGGIRFQSFFLTEHLASHGFVVAAPDHPGNTLLDFGQLGDDAATAQSAVDRPLDMRVTADRAIAGTLVPGLAVDSARVAIAGHSFGGWTALEAARQDPRFEVVLPLAPGFRAGSTPDFVADLARPLAIFGGTLDETCPWDTDQQLPYEIAQTPKALLGAIGAGHLDFTDLCSVPLATAFIDDGCDPANIDPQVVHARVKLVAAAFLRRYLTDEVGYEPYLDPGYVAALGNVSYWRAP